jgi:hypothetical protein
MMPEDRHILRLLLSSGFGALIYGSTLVVLHRERVRGILRYVKALRQGRSTSTEKNAG